MMPATLPTAPPAGGASADEILYDLLGNHIPSDAIRELTAHRRAEGHTRESLANMLVRRNLAAAELTAAIPLLDGSRVRVDSQTLWVRNYFIESVRFSDCWFGPPESIANGVTRWELPLPGVAFTSTLIDREAVGAYLQNPETAQPPSREWPPAGAKPLSVVKPPSPPAPTTSASDDSGTPTHPSYSLTPAMPTRVPPSRSLPAEQEDAHAEPGRKVPQAGETVGRCLLVSEVGHGASGVVFQAIHQKLQIPVAVKVLTPDSPAGKARLQEMLKREARLLAQLNHPNVVRVFDYEDEGDLLYVILEFVEGLDLANLIGLSGCVTSPRAVRIVAQTAAGLGAAAKLGIIHRDVKPANILLSRDDTSKIADLGLGASVSGGGVGSSSLVGTVAYMAPEQARCDSALDHRADIYSLGATLYHALTGKLPFTGRSNAEVLMKHLRDLPAPPSFHVPEVPRGLDAVVLRMMAKDPKERPQTYDELLSELAPFAGTGSGVIGQDTANRSGLLSTQDASGGDNRKWSIFGLFGNKPGVSKPRK